MWSWKCLTKDGSKTSDCCWNVTGLRPGSRWRMVSPTWRRVLLASLALVTLLVDSVCAAIQIQPFNFPGSVLEGQSVQVMCGISQAEGEVRFRWLRNGVTISSGGHVSLVSHPRLSVLMVNEAIGELSGNYTCMAESQGQEDTHTAQLIVQGPPKWAKEPKDTAVSIGDSAKIDCSAIGYPVPKIKWTKLNDTKGSDLESPGHSHHRFNADGSLTITSVRQEDAGQYTCEASNGIGQTLQKLINLHIKGAPVIQPFFFPKNVSSGQDLKVMCTVTAGHHPMAFQWIKDERGASLMDASRTHVQSFDDYSMLTIKGADREHAGNYTCIAKNGVGKDSYSAQLSVLVSPRWTEEPSDVQVAVSKQAVLQCKAEGFPEPKIVWRRKKDSSLIPVTDDGHFRLSANGSSLTVDSAKPEDTGQYECEVTNGVGDKISKIISLSIHVPVRFEERFEVRTIQRGDTAKLKCEAMGDNPITITWTKNKEVIAGREDSSAKYEVFDSITATGTSSELHVPAAERRDSAVFNCVAQNKFGKDDRTIKLVVLEVPSAPLDIRVEQSWSRSASVRWTPPFSGNSPITKFVLQYWRDAGAPHRLEEESVAPSQSTALLKDLQPGTSYVIRVLAENEIGRGSASETQQFSTKEEEPEGAPTDVWVEARGAGALRVKWKPPPKDQWNGQLKGYYIGYKVQGSVEPFAYKTVDFGETLEEEYALTALLKSTAYTVVVKAFNNAGSGPSSQEVSATTPDTDPPVAPSVWVESQSSSSIGLKWEQKAGPGGPVTHFILHYQGEYGPWTELTIPGTAGKKYSLTGLQEGTRYQLYMTAVSEAGQSDPSDTLTVRTEGGALSDSSSYPVTGPQLNIPLYLQMTVVIPVAVSLAIILLVSTGACIYVKREQKRCRAVLAMRMAEKRSSYGNTLPHPHPSRYSVEQDKSKPLLHHQSLTPGPQPQQAQFQRPPVNLQNGPPPPPPMPGMGPPPGGYPAPYATLPLKTNTVDKRRLSAENKPKHGSRPSVLQGQPQGSVDKNQRGASGSNVQAVVHHYDVAA